MLIHTVLKLNSDFFTVFREEEWLTMINRQGMIPEFRSSKTSRFRYKICSLHFDDSMIVLHRSLSINATPAFNLPGKTDTENVFLTDKIVQTDKSDNLEKSLLWELNDATFIHPQPLKVMEKRTLSTQTVHEAISHAEIEIKCSPYIEPSTVIGIKQEIIPNSNSVLISKDINEDRPSTTEPNGDFENTLTELSTWLKTLKLSLKDKNLFKNFALVLYFTCTPLYENIQKTLGLPSVSTLLKWNIDISCEIDRPIVNFFLSHKLMLMGNKSKYCVLFMDAIDIKPHVYYNITKDKFMGLQQNVKKKSSESGVKATSALFIMLRGIHNDWEQLINCLLINERKTYLQSDFMNSTLKMLVDIGFQVKTIVIHPNSYKYAKEVLKITSEKPYILFNLTEVFFMFEPRDLILHLRDQLLDNDFYNINGNKISWKYVEDLYQHKQKYKLSILPKLTRAHVFPNDRQKSDYKYASEIFSDEISSTLEFYISLSLIPRDALPTARFIRSISFLIDIFSSNSVNHENHLKCAFKMNKQQCSVLFYIQDLLKTLSIISKENKTTKTNNIFDCMLITIHSLLLLNNSLKDVGMSHFMTKRFHRDPIDKLKKKIRNAFKGKVTAVKLLKIMGNHFIRQLIRDKKFYCIPNNLNELQNRGKSIAASLTQLENKTISQSKGKGKSRTTKSLKGDFDYRFKLPEKRKITYLSAYLFYKCYKKHRCSDIEREWGKMKISNDLPWNDCLPNILKGNLRKPTPAFHQMVYHFEQALQTNFDRAKDKPLANLGTALTAVFKNHKPICKCFPVNYLLLLFLRHRIYSVMIHNRDLCKQMPLLNIVLDNIIHS